MIRVVMILRVKIHDRGFETKLVTTSCNNEPNNVFEHSKSLLPTTNLFAR